MDSGNLSVILAPNLLHSGDGAEKMNANTEKRLKLQAAIVHCFIENAHNFGMTSETISEIHPNLQVGFLVLNAGIQRMCFRYPTSVSTRESSGHDGL